MAVTFSSTGCKDAADSLTKSAGNLDSILNTELSGVISKVKSIYSSDTADKLYDSYDKVKQKFPEFISAVTECANYLTNTVAPSYEKLEQTAASKIN